MKHNAFFVKSSALEEYLQKYGRGIRSKDYEFEIALQAKTFWEKKDGKTYAISFEQNNKAHNYPQRFNPTAEDLKDILRTYNKEDAPVDFALAPTSTSGELAGFSYPFQIKKYVPESDVPNNEAFAEYINKKANKYRASDTSLIIFPELLGKESRNTYDIAEIIKLLKIDEGAIRTVFAFQYINNTPRFLLLWASQEALQENPN